MTAFGSVLKDARKACRVSQLELAVEADVSARHISFIESGRSKPSRDMILRLATVMDLPLRETNILLSAAGFSAEYQESALDAPALADVRNALEHMMRAHLPYPAVVIDELWNILMTNQTMNMLFEVGAAEPIDVIGSNMMELLFDTQAFQPLIRNWQEVATYLLQRVHKEHLLSARKNSNNELLERLLAFPNIPTGWRLSNLQAEQYPILNMELVRDELELKLFSTIATFGTPMDVTVQNIRIEYLFPADPVTREFFAGLTS